MKATLLVLLFTIVANLGYSQIINSGNAFVPANYPGPTDPVLTEGGTVTFTLGQFHDAVEVTQATYEANGTTPKIGGFSVPFGGGTTHPLTTAGIYYYVCTNHAGSAMKGTITVTAATGIDDKMNTVSFLEINPNPVNSVSAIKFSLNTQAEVEVVIFNSLGIKRMDLGKKMYANGEHTVDFNAAALEDGLYTAMILVNGETAASKKIIIKK